MCDEYNKITKDHFYYWVAACKKWIEFFGLYDWECRFYLMEGNEDSPRASMQPYDMENRLLGLTLYDSWDIEPSDYNLFRTAFHEVHEIMLVDINLGAMKREFDAELQDREHHRLIRRLENSVFEDMWKGGHGIFNFQPDAEGRSIARPEIPEFHNDENVLDTRVSGEEQNAGRWFNRLSPLQRLKGWWNRNKTT